MILTTNFDRLMERALEEAWIPPRVLSRTGATGAFNPLPHAGADVRERVDLGRVEEDLAVSIREGDPAGLVQGQRSGSGSVLARTSRSSACQRYPPP